MGCCHGEMSCVLRQRNEWMLSLLPLLAIGMFSGCLSVRHDAV